MQAYHQESARKCPLNGMCDCCTCRCCGLCILICWVIFGAIGGIIGFTYNSDLDSHTNCPDNTANITGECCSFDLAGNTYVFAGSCDPIKTSNTISGINSIG